MDPVRRRTSFGQVSIQAGGALARIAPARGGLVTAFRVGRHDVLYMDDESFADATRPVQGGIPFLFPNADALADDVLRETGTRLLKHGFARWHAWRAVAHSATSLALELSSADIRAAEYPYDFLLNAVVEVSAQRLRVDMRVANRGGRPMPVASGWHPYLAVPHAEKPQVTSCALGAMTANIHDADEIAFSTSFSGTCDITFSSRHTVLVRASRQHTVLRIWSLPGRDFLCCEPWIGPIDALNHPEERLTVLPGATEHLWMELALDV